VKKPKNQPAGKPRVQPQEKRRHLIIPAFLLLGALICLSLAFGPKRQTSAAATESTSATASAVQLPTEFAEGYAKLDSILSVAKSAAKGEPLAESLVDEFSKRAVVGKVKPDGNLTMMPRRNLDRSEVVGMVFVSKAEMKYVPVKLESPYMYDPSINSVVCGEVDAVSDGLLSTILLHELYHWRRFMDRGRSMNRTAEESRLEEVKAHELEFRALDRLTDGRFSRKIRQVLKGPGLSRPGTKSPYLYPTPEGEAVLNAIWRDPPLSEFEKDIRTSGIRVAWFFAQSPSESEKAEVYSLVRSQYSHQDFRKE